MPKTMRTESGSVVRVDFARSKAAMVSLDGSAGGVKRESTRMTQEKSSRGSLAPGASVWAS